ncbi:MAG: ABC transporter permease [Rhodothermales bacterium]
MKEEQHHSPPRLAAALLGWLLKDVWGTPLGDYEEYFNELVETEGKQRARWWYRGQVLRLLPDRLFEKLYWGREMIRNYFTLGFRNLKKHKTVSFINILGLSGGIACTIAVFLFLKVINETDTFHEHGNRVFLIGHTVEQFGEEERWGTTPIPLGPALAADFPQIERVVRYAGRGAMVRTTGIGFQETVSFADAGFFEVLTFPLQKGNTRALDDPKAVIISAEMAAKYFRDENPIGQEIFLTFEAGAQNSSEDTSTEDTSSEDTVEGVVQHDIELPFTVGGVAEAFPGNPSFKFDFLLNYESLLHTSINSLVDWSLFTDATFVMMNRAEDIGFIQDQLGQYIAPQNEANASWLIGSFFVDNIKSPSWDAWEITRRAMRAPDPWATLVMGAIALLTLLVACFNYINISLGFASSRLTEIGIRKTAGAEKKQLVFQLLTENIILCFVALVIGLAFAWLVVIPLFNELFVGEIPLDFVKNLGFWAFLVGLLGFLGLVSGAYPAFYISSFQPIAILRGKQKLGNKKRLTHSLMTVQFVLTFISISVCTFFFSFNGYLTGQDWGYTADQTIVVPIINHTQYLELRDAGMQMPQVLEVSGTQDQIGVGSNRQVIQLAGQDEEAIVYGVGPDYLSSMNIALHEGTGFEGKRYQDGVSEVVINETFAMQYNWQHPVGQSFRYDEQQYTVVGVAKDFLVFPFLGEEMPVFFNLTSEEAYQYITFRIEPGTEAVVAGMLERTWQKEFPEVPFEFFLQNDVFEDFYNSLRNLTRNIGYLALFSLLVSCMGLFGMASQKAARHMKEIGVRKVLGATASHVILLVNWSFLIILGIATLIATPLCYFGIKTALSFAPTEIPLNALPFILANAIVFSMAALSLALQMRRLVRVNPSDVLRHA